MRQTRHKTRCPECGQWRRVTSTRGTEWLLEAHERPAFRGSLPCRWLPGPVHTAIVWRGVVVRDAIAPSPSTPPAAPE